MCIRDRSGPASNVQLVYPPPLRTCHEISIPNVGGNRSRTVFRRVPAARIHCPTKCHCYFMTGTQALASCSIGRDCEIENRTGSQLARCRANGIQTGSRLVRNRPGFRAHRIAPSTRNPPLRLEYVVSEVVICSVPVAQVRCRTCQVVYLVIATRPTGRRG